MTTLERCANGCDAKPVAPSKVICKPCQDKITARLEALVSRQQIGCTQVGSGGYHSASYGDDGGRCEWCGKTPDERGYS